MKTIALMVLCVAAACGAGRQADPAQSAKMPAAQTGEGQPCTQEIALVCPDGQIDTCEKALAEDNTAPTEDDGADESGGTGTAMALGEGRMAKLERAGTHRCVPK